MLLLTAMLLPQTAWALYGSGTYDDPCHVTLGKDLLTIADEVKEGKWDNTRMIVYLDNDVYLSRMITRIGTEAHPFRGSFDGNGHSINFSSPLNYGLNSNCTGVLFDYTSAAQICNITVNGKISSSTEGLTHIGGLVGYDKGGYFSQIEVNDILNKVKNNLSENTRAEEISIEKYIEIAKNIKHINHVEKIKIIQRKSLDYPLTFSPKSCIIFSG